MAFFSDEHGSEMGELLEDAIRRYECLIGLMDGKINSVSSVTMAIDKARFGHLVLPQIEIPGLGMRPVFDHDKAVAFVCGLTGLSQSVCEQGVRSCYTNARKELGTLQPDLRRLMEVMLRSLEQRKIPAMLLLPSEDLDDVLRRFDQIIELTKSSGTIN